MVAIAEKDYDGYPLVLNNKGLFAREWDNGKKRVYKVKKITKAINLFAALDKVIKIEEGTRLEAIFKLLANDSAYQAVTFGFPNSWVAEYVEEYLRVKEAGVIKKWNPDYNDDEIEFLELYWHMYQDDDFYKRHGDKKLLWGAARPDFHGVGFEQRETKKDRWGNIECKKGSRIGYAVEFSPIENLLDIPLRLDLECKLYDEDKYKHVGKKHEWVMEMTLYQVIYGIFWEISFCGGPVSKDKEKKELDKVSKEVSAAIESGDMSKFKTLDLDRLKELTDGAEDKS